MANSGYLSAADTILYCDSLAAVFRGVVTSLPAVNALAKAAQTSILGDGGTNAGLSNGDVKAAIKGNLPALVNAYDLTRVWAGQSALLSALDTQIRQSLPSAWNFLGNVSALHFLDAHLTRINAGAGAPVGGQSHRWHTDGRLQRAGRAARVFVVAMRPAWCIPLWARRITGEPAHRRGHPGGALGSQNILCVPDRGNRAAGVTKVRLYRGLVGGVAGVYYWLKDVAVTAGAAYPAIPHPGAGRRTQAGHHAALLDGRAPHRGVRGALGAGFSAAAARRRAVCNSAQTNTPGADDRAGHAQSGQCGPQPHEYVSGRGQSAVVRTLRPVHDHGQRRADVDGRNHPDRE